MSDTEQKKTREELNSYLGRAGHGSIGDVVREAGVSRSYLGRFRRGDDVEKKVYIAIRAALDKLKTPDSAQETGVPYGRVQRSGRSFDLPSAADIEDALRQAKRNSNTKLEEEIRALQRQIFDLADRADKIASKFDEVVSRLGG